MYTLQQILNQALFTAWFNAVAVYAVRRAVVHDEMVASLCIATIAGLIAGRLYYRIMTRLR